MQSHGAQRIDTDFKKPQDPFVNEILGVINPYAANFHASGALESEAAITQKQIDILEDAIRRYERLEDVRKFSSLVLEDIETVTEEDIQRALELENTVSIEDEKAVLNLIQNEGFLKDLESADFTEILASCGDVLEGKAQNADFTEDIKENIDTDAQRANEDFSDFDF